MTPLAEIEARIDRIANDAANAVDPVAAASELLRLAEAVLEHWLCAHDKAPTDRPHEGFRILALHRQGAKGDPSFNACRETCREVAYHYNLIALDATHAETKQRLAMMAMVAMHLYLFVSGKMETAALGEFCCSARPLRASGG
jgi:hypothetical protein